MGLDHRGALGAHLDTFAIVAFFGGADELARALRAHRIARLTPFAVKQWCRRRHIPFPRRLDLEALAKKQARRFTLSKYECAAPPKPTPKKKKAKH